MEEIMRMIKNAIASLTILLLIGLNISFITTSTIGGFNFFNNAYAEDCPWWEMVFHEEGHQFCEDSTNWCTDVYDWDNCVIHRWTGTPLIVIEG